MSGIRGETRERRSSSPENIGSWRPTRHVAEINHKTGGLVALRNGSCVAYEVEKVWYHPGYTRAKSEGVNVRSGGRWVSYRGVLSPDLAVIRLADGGPEIEAECRLARPVESDDPRWRPVGLLGFSGPWPPPGRPMKAVFKTGFISLTTDFSPVQDLTPRWTMVDFTAPGREGDSGGPVFADDGRVIAVFAWGRNVNRGEADGSAETSAGIRVDALWEMLDHHGLKNLVPASPDG